MAFKGFSSFNEIKREIKTELSRQLSSDTKDLITDIVNKEMAKTDKISAEFIELKKYFESKGLNLNELDNHELDNDVHLVKPTNVFGDK